MEVFRGCWTHSVYRFTHMLGTVSPPCVFPKLMNRTGLFCLETLKTLSSPD